MTKSSKPNKQTEKVVKQIRNEVRQAVRKGKKKPKKVRISRGLSISRSRSRSYSASSRGSVRSASSLSRSARRGPRVPTASSEDCFYHGLLEPQNGARGPPSAKCNKPTVVIPYKTYGSFVTTPNPATDISHAIGPTGAWAYYLDNTAHTGGSTVVNAANYNFHPEQPYMHNNAGEIAIVACPHFTTANFLDTSTLPASYTQNSVPGFDPRFPSLVKTSTLSTRLVAGFTCDPQNDTGEAGVYRTSATDARSTCKPYPLNPLNLDLPTAPTEFGLLEFVPRRCVGLKLTVTVNTPALTAVGSVRAGDNRPWQMSDIRVFGPDSKEPPKIVVNEGNKLANKPLNTLQATPGNGMRQLGNIASGNTYEVCWIPNGENAMQWDTTAIRCAATAQKMFAAQTDPALQEATLFTVGSGYPGDYGEPDDAFTMTRGTLWENNPMCYLVFSGFDKTAGLSLTYGITVAYEYQMIVDSTLSNMFSEFAFAKRFLPEYSEIISLTNSSNWARDPSVVAHGIKERPMIKMGAMCAQHLALENPLRKPDPEMMGIGAAVASDSFVQGTVSSQAVLRSLTQGSQATKLALSRMKH